MSGLQTFLAGISPTLGQLGGLPLGVFVLVVLLTGAFLVGYGIRGIPLWWRLRASVRRIELLRKAGSSVRPDDLADIFRWAPVKHLWAEYSHTLHELKKASNGELSVVEVRATVPAEAFFTREVLVDSRLFDDFTRHLPGVLTGLGIIGTFAGLLDGLGKFDPSSTAAAVSGLKPLMAGVQHAFVASAAAIGCAMGVTFASRLVLACLYQLVERLNQAIDALYETGAGEEYLSRLVQSSERNEAHTAQLKDALVEDMTKLMNNLVDRQIQAQQEASRLLGDRIGETISGSLAAPIQRMTDAMEQTHRGNGEAVTGMLETMLSGFMAKLEDTFGGQMRGINEQMQRSMDAMTAVQSSLQSLLSDIKTTNEHAASQMSGTLEEAMKKAADNQQVLTDQMRQFVQEFRSLVSDEQEKSKRAMDDAVMKVLGEVAAGMERMEGFRKAAAAEETSRNQQLSDQTNQLVGGLTTQVDGLLKSVADQVTKTQHNIDALGNVSLRAIDGMNQGALTLSAAAQRFESAGSAVSGVFDRSTRVSEQLTSAANTLQVAAVAVQRGFDQYDSTRRTVDAQVASLTGLIEAAKKEAGVSKDLVESIKASVEALRRAESDSRTHLDSVNDALLKAFHEFGIQLVGSVKQTIAETDRHLSQGTGHLNGVVQELATAVHRMRKT
ncbi:anti-phage ZorAB system protein ZorA [Cupriavidus sp. 2MCAB6]|uniref:anti-phage ZorAB system protein ZorA n=1 Tax=Cupriavidus sp. 2MCAB6 TaxID=3232981 RepID=UPI003F934DC5